MEQFWGYLHLEDNLQLLLLSILVYLTAYMVIDPLRNFLSNKAFVMLLFVCQLIACWMYLEPVYFGLFSPLFLGVYALVFEHNKLSRAAEKDC